jgi:hypothetical protein
MKPALCATALAVAALVMTAVAVAVPPSGGATYTGKTTGHKSPKPLLVKLKVAPDGKSLTFAMTCLPSKGFRGVVNRQTYSLRGIKINAQGGFSKNGKVEGVPLKVSGKFTSATKASGKFETVICFADKPSFTATR